MIAKTFDSNLMVIFIRWSILYSDLWHFVARNRGKAFHIKGWHASHRVATLHESGNL